jgi:hypothetical protein
LHTDCGRPIGFKHWRQGEVFEAAGPVSPQRRRRRIAPESSATTAAAPPKPGPAVTVEAATDAGETVTVAVRSSSSVWAVASLSPAVDGEMSPETVVVHRL